MSNLYQLSSRYQQLMDLDELNEPELLELESLHDNIEDKCIDYGKYIRNLEAELAAVKEARLQMVEREKALAHKIEKKKENLCHIMRDNHLMKITKSPLFPLSVKKNRPSVEPYQPEAIPKTFIRVTEKVIESVDKEKIREAIEAGEEVAGARLIVKYRVDFK